MSDLIGLGVRKIKKLVDCIKGSEHYIKEFATWERL